MFCPKCKSEYREGYTTCTDCQVPLVETLRQEEDKNPPGTRNEHTDFELIYTTYKFSDVALIKSVFESEGITYFIQGEDLGVAPGGLPARVLVMTEQVEEAKQLLKDYLL